MGVWKHTGSPSQYLKVHRSEAGSLKEIKSLGKKRPDNMSSDVFRIRKNYSCHHAASDLSRTVIFIEGINEVTLICMEYSVCTVSDFDIIVTKFY